MNQAAAERWNLDYFSACIVGKKRKGKTYLAKLILQHGGQFVVIDPDDEYRDIAEPDQYFDDMPVDTVIMGLTELRREGMPIRAVIVPMQEDEPFILDELSRWVLDSGNITLAVDEAHDFVSARSIPDGFRKLARKGAKRGCRVVAISQRHVDVNTSFFSQCDLLVSFQQLLPRDIEYIERYSGLPDLRELLTNLKRGEYIVINEPQAITVCGSLSVEL